MKTIHVYGAGLSGLTAALCLARDGYRVKVFEREKRLGGSPQFHPSAHLTPMSFDSLHRYLGFPVADAFTPVSKFTAFVGDQAHELAPGPLHVVERGPREESLDTYLYQMALEREVEFHFGSPLTRETLDQAPADSIISTGLHKDMFDALGVPQVTFDYYIYNGPTHLPASAYGYWNDYTSDYGYVAVANGMMLALVFCRYGLKENARDRFAQALKDTIGVEVPQWLYYRGSNPVQPTFLRDRFILTGNLAGMWEPAFCFGIVGALFSGRLAATAVADRAAALKEFRRFTRFHPIMYKVPPLLARVSWAARRPGLNFLLEHPWLGAPGAWLINRAIPGYDGPNFIQKKPA